MNFAEFLVSNDDQRGSLFQRGFVQIKLQHQQSLFHFFGLEPERAAAAFVGDFSFGVDHIQAGRHSAVGITDSVIDIVNEQRNRWLELAAHCSATELRSSYVVG